MQTILNSIFILIILSTVYLSVAFLIETKRFDDTIVYESVSENTYVRPSVPEEIATTSASTSTENVPITMEEIPVEEEVEPPSPPQIKAQQVLVEQIEIEIPVETPEEIIEENQFSFAEINDMTRPALVNIFCLTKGPHQYITPISGSGTLIHEDGVILTNAHIAQFWLFEDFPSEGFVNCQIRTGSPAKPAYRAKLLYISPQWIRDNAEAISTENPMGTGEDDYALLFITESMTNSPLPENFPHIDYDSGKQVIKRDESVLVGAYPAGFLGGRTIQQDLYASTAIVNITELYTFENPDNLDLISLGGSVVAQQGASGGPAVNSSGKAVGLISTSSDGDSTDERDLRAITLEHIDRSLQENNNTSLENLLSGNLNEKADAFNETSAPPLLQILLNSF